jgi:hypothetical protein
MPPFGECASILKDLTAMSPRDTHNKKSHDGKGFYGFENEHRTWSHAMAGLNSEIMHSINVLTQKPLAAILGLAHGSLPRVTSIHAPKARFCPAGDGFLSGLQAPRAERRVASLTLLNGVGLEAASEGRLER